MSSSKVCPAHETWSRYSQQQVCEEEASQLEEHLSGCRNCLETLKSLHVVDSLTATFQEEAPTPRDRGQLDVRFESLLARLKSLHASDTSSIALCETPPPTAVSYEPKCDRFPFLHSPKSDGELGYIDTYRVICLIGQGGMGYVFEAEDLRLKRRVALKVMRPALAADPAAHSRFLREARTMAALEHERIVAVHAVGEQLGFPYFAMPLLRGRSLHDHLKHRPMLPCREALRIALETAEGLAAAHARGLVHRDIKPSNIWLERKRRTLPDHHGPLQGASTNAAGNGTPGGSPSLGRERITYNNSCVLPDELRGETVLEGASCGDPQMDSIELGDFKVKLVDFGLASDLSVQSELTPSQAIVGAPAYMSPEQVQARPLDGRSDLFSLGCVIYQMLTGRLPFDGPSILDVLNAVRRSKPISIKEVRRDVPDEVLRLVDRLLAKERERRPASADEVAGELRRLLGTIDSTKAERRPRNLLLNGIALFAAIMAIVAGVLLFWQTPKGTVRIEVEGKGIEARIDDYGTTITGTGSKELHIEPGEHNLRITHGDLQFETDNFLLAKNGIVSLRIRRIAGNVQVLANGKPIVVTPFSNRPETREQKQFEQPTPGVLLATAKEQFERGHALCMKGDVNSGVLWFAKALRRASDEGDSKLECTIRMQLGGWRDSITQLKVIKSHKDPIEFATLDPTGSTLLTVASTSHVLDIATGGSLSLSNDVLRGTFSPDGRHLLLDVSREGMAVYKWQNGALERISPKLGETACWNSDGSRVLAFDDVIRLPSTLTFWEAKDWTPVGSQIRIEKVSPFELACSPDGRSIAVGGYGGFEIWNIEEMPRLSGQFLQNHAIVTSIAFTPDSSEVVTCTLPPDSTVPQVAFWSRRNAELVAGPFQSSRRSDAPIVHVLDAKWVAGSLETCAMVSNEKPVDLAGNIPIQELQLNTSSRRLIDAAASGFAVGERKLSVICPENEVRILQVPTRKAKEIKYDTRVLSLAFSPDGTKLASVNDGGKDGRQVLVCDLATAKVRPMLEYGSVAGIAYLAEAQLQVAKESTQNAATNSFLDLVVDNFFPPSRKTDGFLYWESIQVSPRGDGRSVVTVIAPDFRVASGTASAVGNAMKRTWNAFVPKIGSSTGSPTSNARPDFTRRTFSFNGIVETVAMSSDSHYLVVSTLVYKDGSKGELFLLDLTKATGKEIGQLMGHNERAILTVAIHPTGAYIASGGYDSEVRFWSMANGAPVQPSLPHESPVTSLAISPDGKWLTTGTLNGNLRIYKSGHWSQFASIAHSPGKEIRSLAFSQDGRRFVATSGNSAVPYDAETGKPTGLPMEHEGVTSAIFNPAGDQIATAGHATEGLNNSEVWFWQSPRALEGDPKEIERAVQVATGQYVAEDGLSRTLSLERWNELQTAGNEAASGK